MSSRSIRWDAFQHVASEWNHQVKRIYLVDEQANANLCPSSGTQSGARNVRSSGKWKAVSFSISALCKLRCALKVIYGSLPPPLSIL